MIYLLILYLFFFSYWFPKSKFLMFLLFLLLLIISVFVQVGYDINNYRESYSVLYTDLEERSALFSGLMIMSHGLGLNFSFFRLLCFLIWGLVIFTFVRRYSQLPNYTLVCCFLFPMLTFSSQIRNGVAVGFIYMALSFLFAGRRFWNIFFFTVFLLIATAFHKLSFLYFVCLIAIFPIGTRKLLNISLFTVFIVTIALFTGFFQTFLRKLSPDNYYVANYVGRPQFDVMLIAVLFFIVFFYTYLSGRSYSLCRISSHLKQKQKVFSAIVYRINIIFLAFLPLLFISGSFFRIFQNLILLSAISVTNASTITKLVPYNGQYDRFFYFLFFIMASFFYLTWQGGFFEAMNSIVLF